MGPGILDVAAAINQGRKMFVSSPKYGFIGTLTPPEKRPSSRRRRALVVGTLLALGLSAFLLFGNGGPSTTVVVNGQRVFRISFPTCHDTASCAAAVKIGGTLYAWSDTVTPQAKYRTGPLYAVGSDSEARVVPALTTRRYTTIAIRVGTVWSMAFSPGEPEDTSWQHQLCMFTINPAGSYCVVHQGFPVST